MTQYIIDGSQKGLAIGAGIVEIRNNGFFNLKNFTTYHTAASSVLAEIFALESSLKLIKALENEFYSRILIFSDNSSVIKFFNDDLKNSNLSSDTYISGIQRQIISLSKMTDISVHRIGNEYLKLHNIAHNLSRLYLQDPNNEAFYNEKSIDLPMLKTSVPLKNNIPKEPSKT
ncbi:hypothetical protein [Bacillus coahuilensis]|uniref:hypothetical protein n=1 Tax=Bacillus coahuilensis TaxID=408580 RepID=UPI00018506E8|nr:hypothetical protein [Bacillus coahuilensis]